MPNIITMDDVALALADLRAEVVKDYVTVPVGYQTALEIERDPGTGWFVTFRTWGDHEQGLLTEREIGGPYQYGHMAISAVRGEHARLMEIERRAEAEINAAEEAERLDDRVREEEAQAAGEPS